MMNIFEARETINNMEKEINQRKIEEAEKIYKKVYNHPCAINDKHYEFFKEVQEDLNQLILILKEYR